MNHESYMLLATDAIELNACMLHPCLLLSTTHLYATSIGMRARERIRKRIRLSERERVL